MHDKDGEKNRFRRCNQYYCKKDIPIKDKIDFVKEFQAIGKNFEGTIRRRAPDGEEANPPILIPLIGPPRLLTVERGDWVWLINNVSWAANADNTRIVFSIVRTSYDGEVIYSIADTESQGGFASTTMTGVDIFPLIDGNPKEFQLTSIASTQPIYKVSKNINFINPRHVETVLLIENK